MRNLLIATAGFLVGIGLVIALLVALPRTTKVTVNPPPSQVAGMQHMGNSVSTAPASRKLTIRHVLRGCHVWSNGSRTAAMLRLALQRGGKLSILDQDVDAHRLIQLSGPTLRRADDDEPRHVGLVREEGRLPVQDADRGDAGHGDGGRDEGSGQHFATGCDRCMTKDDGIRRGARRRRGSWRSGGRSRSSAGRPRVRTL
jgi:hypothetical protein